MASFVVAGEKKSLLALALASGESPTEAAALAGVSHRTVQRRLADPAFRQLVAKLQSELMSRALGCMAKNMARAAKRLETLLDKDDPSIQLRAARAVLGMGMQLRDSVDVDARLREVEAELARKLGGVP